MLLWGLLGLTAVQYFLSYTAEEVHGVVIVAEAYDILRVLGGLSNEELSKVFTEWNQGDLQSFLIEISAVILGKKDDKAEGYLVDKIVDKTGAKGTGG
jgi:6-phosphogluconate dehydrogenase